MLVGLPVAEQRLLAVWRCWKALRLSHLGDLLDCGVGGQVNAEDTASPIIVTAISPSRIREVTGVAKRRARPARAQLEGEEPA